MIVVKTDHMVGAVAAVGHLTTANIQVTKMTMTLSLVVGAVVEMVVAMVVGVGVVLVGVVV